MLIPIFQRLVAHALQSDFNSTYDILLYSASSAVDSTFAWLKVNGVRATLMKNTPKMCTFNFLLSPRWLEHDKLCCDFFHRMLHIELSKTSDCFQQRVLKSMLLSACECNGVISHFNKTFLPANTKSIEELEIWLDIIDV